MTKLIVAFRNFAKAPEYFLEIPIFNDNDLEESLLYMRAIIHPSKYSLTCFTYSDVIRYSTSKCHQNTDFARFIKCSCYLLKVPL